MKSVSFTSLSDKFLAYWDQIPPWVILFVLFMAHNWGIDIAGGEAQYLGYAKEFMDPGWIPGSFTFTEIAGHRILFQLLIGSLAHYLSFPVLIGLLRALNFLAYAIVLGKLLRFLRIPAWVIFVLFEIYLVAPQSFFAAEWFFISFEPKTVASVCMFAALYRWLRGRWQATTWWSVAATWFHFPRGWVVHADRDDRVPGTTAVETCVESVPAIWHLYSSVADISVEYAAQDDAGSSWHISRLDICVLQASASSGAVQKQRLFRTDASHRYPLDDLLGEPHLLATPPMATILRMELHAAVAYCHWRHDPGVCLDRLDRCRRTASFGRIAPEIIPFPAERSV